MPGAYAGKRLLILGGAVQCLKVVEAAKAMGIHTIVTDVSENGAAKLAADEALPYSVTDTEGLYRWCREHPVDGILNYCIDFSQHTHQVLCERLGLPSYGTGEQYRCLTDKTAFKALCRRSGVDVIPEYEEDHLDEVEYPVLVKPAESSGSRGLAICGNEGELRRAIEEGKAASRNGQVIIEKYMGGKQDFTVTFLIVEGEPYLIRVGDRHLGRAEDGLDRQCIATTSPSVFTDLYMEKAHDAVLRMLRSLGLRNGPVFFQGFIDGDRIRFYDPGIRFPGGEYDRLFRAAVGIDLPSAMVSFAVTGRIPLREELSGTYRLNGKVAVQLTVTARPGTIGTYAGLDEIGRLPGVVFIAPKAGIGTIIPPSGDVRQRVLEADFLADGQDRVRPMAERIYAGLHIADENGEDMVVSRLIG